jgi:two-component system sensor histidine kinase PilS (NtrC family)
MGMRRAAVAAGRQDAGTPPVVSAGSWACAPPTSLAALSVRLLVRPPRPGARFDPQWVSTIGIDLLAFSTLQFLQAAGLNYAPLFALPVLTAAVLGSTLLALGTAAGVTLLLLADAWVLALQLSDHAQRWCRPA